VEEITILVIIDSNTVIGVLESELQSFGIKVIGTPPKVAICTLSYAQNISLVLLMENSKECVQVIQEYFSVPLLIHTEFCFTPDVPWLGIMDCEPEDLANEIRRVIEYCCEEE